jgi:hypothetical protein
MCQIWRTSLGVGSVFIGVFLVLCGSAIATEDAAVTTVVQNSADKVASLDNSAEETLTENAHNDDDDALTEEPADPTSSVLEQINEYSNDADPDNPLGQVTNVSQLADVKPGDWAYEALRSLVERYGVIAGYPDGTFRGNRAITRYEFAAGLQRVLDQIDSLTSRGEDLVTNEDVAILQQLREGFIVELAIRRGDVDGLTARITELELTQFSTTTQLKGEVVFGLAGIAAGDGANGNSVDDVTILGHRTRLNLETSFTGRDLLRTRLQAEGLGSLESRTLTPEGELAFSGATDSDVKLDSLLYRFPLGSRTEVVVAANAGDADDFSNTINPYLDGDGASGAISGFATRPSIYYLVKGAGLGVRHAFNDKLELSLGYLAGDAGNSQAGAGLFDGAYGALAQLVFQPNERSQIGLTYVHAYNNYLQTGSNSANLLALPAVSNSYGVEASFEVSSRFVLGGWVGYTDAHVSGQGDASIWNWAVTLAFPDLGKTGNLAGIVVGMEPKVTGSDSRLVNLGINDPNTSLHLEAFYQYQLTNNIAITPGVIWLTAPDHNSSNDDVVIGTVRTTFSF